MTSKEDNTNATLDEFDLSDAEDYFNAIDVDYLPDEDDYFPWSETPAAAYHAVLYTAELLERILVHVDTSTLLISQRTCLFWKQCIQGSRMLQRALFFEADTVWDSRFIPASDGSHMCSSHILQMKRCMTDAS